MKVTISKLKLERLKHNISQRELAHMTGLSNVTISHIEAGKRNMNVVTLQRIAKALNVDNPLDLVGEVEIEETLNERNENHE